MGHKRRVLQLERCQIWADARSRSQPRTEKRLQMARSRCCEARDLFARPLLAAPTQVVTICHVRPRGSSWPERWLSCPRHSQLRALRTADHPCRARSRCWRGLGLLLLRAGRPTQGFLRLQWLPSARTGEAWACSTVPRGSRVRPRDQTLPRASGVVRAPGRGVFVVFERTSNKGDSLEDGTWGALLSQQLHWKACQELQLKGELRHSGVRRHSL